MMNNDPEDDPNRFEGRKRLHYGRWDYKYQIAATSAIGAIIIHTTPSAGYPWQVIQTSWSGEEFKLRNDSTPACKMTGWVTDQAAKQLVALRVMISVNYANVRNRMTFDRSNWEHASSN